MRSDVPLFDLACARLRFLFPGSKLVAELDRKLKLAAVAANGGRCLERGCVFRAFQDGRCRQHAADRLAEYSVSPSMLGTKMIPQPRAPQPRAHAHA
jgi:hypothetical protein